ncbi:MAG TPA: helix-turn-helix domain-containing protein [Candidatus Aquicultor sp.]|jgi:AcrR family transcriptional regulator
MNQIAEKKLSTKDTILKITLDLIKDEGFEAVTIRKIAAKANINVALINYHFGSKEILLNAAVAALLDTFRECFDLLDETTVPPKERLQRFLTRYALSLQQYPELIRRLFLQGNLSFKTHYQYVQFIKAMGLNKIQATIQEITGENDPEQLTIIVSHIMGATFLPILMAPMLGPAMGINLPDVEIRIDTLMRHCFK